MDTFRRYVTAPYKYKEATQPEIMQTGPVDDDDDDDAATVNGMIRNPGLVDRARHSSDLNREAADRRAAFDAKRAKRQQMTMEDFGGGVTKSSSFSRSYRATHPGRG